MKSRHAITAFTLAAAGVLAATIPAQGASAPKTETFVFVQTSETNAAVSGAGPLTGLGTASALDSKTIKFDFTKTSYQGSLQVTVAITGQSHKTNQKACIIQFTQKGTWKVTAGELGLAGATGHGTYTVSGTELGCLNSPTPSPITDAIVATFTGPLTVPHFSAQPA